MIHPKWNTRNVEGVSPIVLCPSQADHDILSVAPPVKKGMDMGARLEKLEQKTKGGKPWKPSNSGRN